MGTNLHSQSAQGFWLRVQTARRMMLQGTWRNSRRFDSCFENYDGLPVVVALHIRAQDEPELAAAMAGIISRSSLEIAREREAMTRDELQAWALEVQEAAARRWADFHAGRAAAA